jgi:putative transposase
MQSFLHAIRTIFGVYLDGLTFIRLCFSPRAIVAAENLFLRRQLGLYIERKVKPRRATDAIRFTLARLSRLFDWKTALTIVKPDTLIRWHRKGFRLFWKWKSRPRGRPRVPAELRKLIVEMSDKQPDLGRGAYCRRTVTKDRHPDFTTHRSALHARITPVARRPEATLDDVRRNHAKAVIACDFFVVVTATFQLVYVFFIMEVGTRRLLHFNITRHPTADWTLQQFRECVTGDEGYRFVIHDRDSIYSEELDASLKTLGLTILKTPYKSPQANSFCERLIGTARRECLDFMIPIGEAHIRQTLKSWTAHYNRARPHSSLGPGTPDPNLPKVQPQSQRHCIPKDRRVVATSILGSLHHEYRLEKIVA